MPIKPPITINGTAHSSMLITDTIPIDNIPLSPFQIASTAQVLTATLDTLIHTGAAVTYTLPVATQANMIGRKFTIINHGSGTITFNRSIRTASAAAVTTLLVAAQMTIISDGAEWRRFGV